MKKKEIDKAPNALRNGQIVEDYISGNFTLQNLGDKYGITRERIRQIVALVVPKEFVKKTSRENFKKSHAKRKVRIEIICTVCDDTFKVTPCNKDKKFCSKECRATTFQTPEQRRLLGIKATRRWMENNREHVRERMRIYGREYHRKNRDRINARTRELYKRKKEQL